MDYIYINNQFLTKSVCEMLVKYFELSSNKHFKGNFGDGKTIDFMFKNCDEMYIPEKLEIPFVNSIKMVFDQYCQTHGIGGNFSFERFRIKRYLNNGKEFFNYHTDISSLKTSKRIVAVIMYLSDVEKGGETAIKVSGNEIKIKSEIGKLLIFPANFCYPHAGLAPESGIKYIMTTFIDWA